MISISLIGVAAALVVCAIVAKLLASEPKKASKSEKAVIMKQLLALSEGENALTRKAPSVRARTPLANRSTPPGNGPRPKPKPAIAAMRSNE